MTVAGRVFRDSLHIISLSYPLVNTFFRVLKKFFYLSGGGITGEKNAPEFGWNILRDQIPRNKFRGSAELSGGVVLKSVLLTKQTQNDIIDTNKSRLSSPILFPSLTD